MSCKLFSQSKSDILAIFNAVNLYNRAWYEGDTIKVKKALHPELVKRTLNNTIPDNPKLENTTFEMMVQYIAAGYGKNTPPDKQNDKITILDIYKDIASAKSEAYDLVDYIQLAKMQDGEWKIVNVLWIMK